MPSRTSLVTLVAVPTAVLAAGLALGACRVAQLDPSEAAETDTAALDTAVAGGAVMTTPAAPTPASRADAEREFEQAYARFSRAYEIAQPDSVAVLYAQDAYYLQPGSEILQGRDTIRAGFARFLRPFAERAEPGPGIRFEIVDRQVSGDLATDIGYYQIGSSPGGRGKFIVIWKRGTDGVWRIHADGYSGVEPPGAARRRPASGP